jgi:hypothetical protein
MRPEALGLTPLLPSVGDCPGSGSGGSFGEGNLPTGPGARLGRHTVVRHRGGRR